MEVRTEIDFDLRGQHIRTSRKTLENAKSSVKFKSMLSIFCNKKIFDGLDYFNSRFAPIIRAIIMHPKCGVHVRISIIFR